MHSRTATKLVIRSLFEWIEEKGAEYIFDKEVIEKAIELMHDEDLFLDHLIDFFAEFVDDFGQNYDLWE